MDDDAIDIDLDSESDVDAEERLDCVHDIHSQHKNGRISVLND